MPTTRSHFLTVFLPGALASLPWVSLAAWTSVDVIAEFEEILVLWLVLSAGLSILAGMGLDGALSRWKARFDAQLEEEFDVRENRRFYEERIGDAHGADFDHLRAKEVEVNFDLALVLTAPCFLGGLAMTAFHWSTGPAVAVGVLLLAVALVASTLFYREARRDHARACELRRDLNRRFGESRNFVPREPTAFELETEERYAAEHEIKESWPT